MARWLWILAALMTGGLAWAAPAHAAPPPEAEIEAAEQAQDRVLQEARRGGSMAGVVSTCESRVLRSPTVLNRYLLGRALFHNGDAGGAMREMKAVIQQEPAFWRADLRLAVLHLLKKDPTTAAQHLQRIRPAHPNDPDVLRVTAQIGAELKDWNLMLQALQSLDRLLPGDPEIARGLIQVHIAREDWPAAYQQSKLLRVREPKDPRVRWMYANTAYRTGRLDEAAQELEDLSKNFPQAMPYLALLTDIYFQKKDATRLTATLERVRPFVKDEKKAELDAMLKALAAGRVPGEGPGSLAPAPPGALEEDPVVALVERCLAPDAAVRRAALQEFHAARLGWVPQAILLHYHPASEPDPDCRAWVLRIVAQLDDPSWAKVPGHALMDTDPLVRRVAAEALSAINTPAGLIYLLALVPVLNPVATASEAEVKEWNAVRAALVKLTGFDDVPIGESAWVPAAGLPASAATWDAWFASPVGVAARMRAMRDLIETGETHPEWYLVLQALDGSPEVTRAAHGVLAGRAAEASSDPVIQRMRQRFPKASAEELAEAGLPGLRKRLRDWWAAWLAERDAGDGK